MKSALIVGGGILTALVLQGCATIITGASQDVNFTSDPSGATIRVKGREIQTPGSLKMSKTMGAGPMVTADYPGYKTRTFHVRGRFQPWFLGNILLGGIIGVVVDMVTGAVSPYEDSMHVVLSPEAGGYSGRYDAYYRPDGRTSGKYFGQKRVRPVKEQMFECGACQASVSALAKHCSQCGAEFTE